MKKDVINPFSTSELRIPKECLEEVRRLTATFSAEGGEERDPDRVPFRRYVDFWWAGLGIGVAEGKKVETPAGGWHKFMDGIVLQSDPWRVLHLQLLGLAWTGDSASLGEPNKTVAIANEYAAYGIQVIVSALSGQTEPAWVLTQMMRERCEAKAAGK